MAVLVEFLFYWAASASGAGEREQAHYFANLYLLLNVGALIIQLLVMPRIQRLLEVTGSLMVMPALLLGGGCWEATVGRRPKSRPARQPRRLRIG